MSGPGADRMTTLGNPTAWLGAAGFEPLHLRIGIQPDSQLGAWRSRTCASRLKVVVPHVIAKAGAKSSGRRGPAKTWMTSQLGLARGRKWHQLRLLLVPVQDGNGAHPRQRRAEPVLPAWDEITTLAQDSHPYHVGRLLPVPPARSNRSASRSADRMPADVDCRSRPWS
jgi:hypothetical protein